MLASKRITAIADDEDQPTDIRHTKRKYAAVTHADEDEQDWNEDPFASFGSESTCNRPSATTNDATATNISTTTKRPNNIHKRISTIDALMGNNTTSASANSSSSKRPKHSSSSPPIIASGSASSSSAASPSIASMFSSPPSSASPPVDLCVAPSSSSSSFHQTHINDHLDTDWSKIRAMTPIEKSIYNKRRALENAAICARCNTLIPQGMTLQHHRLIQCKHIPPPIVFASLTLMDQLKRHFQFVRQSPSTYDATKWRNSQLIRLTRTALVGMNTSDGETIRRHVRKTMRWIHSMLNSHEGRTEDDDDSDDADVADGGECDVDSSSPPSSSSFLRPGEELWVHLMKSGTNFLVACAVIVRMDLSDRTIRMNHETVQLRERRHRQQSIKTLFGQHNTVKTSDENNNNTNNPTPTSEVSHRTSDASSVTGSSVSCVDSTSSSSTLPSPLPPIFGVEKIAVHQSYRMKSTAASGSASTAGHSTSPSSSAATVSLGHHVLSSILASRLVVGVDPTRARSSVAFTEPTDAGRRLAIRFTRNQAFNIYDITA